MMLEPDETMTAAFDALGDQINAQLSEEAIQEPDPAAFERWLLLELDNLDDESE